MGVEQNMSADLQVGENKTCDCGCGRSFHLTAQAPHKRFFSEQCRNDFHTRELRALRAQIKEDKEKKAKR